MVAFINYEMPIIADDIIDLSLANQALDQGDALRVLLGRMERREREDKAAPLV